jgi:hypothetical protein
MLPSPATPSFGSNAEQSAHHLFPPPDDTGTFYNSGFAPLYLLLGNLELGVEDSSLTETEGVLFLHLCCQDVSGPILWLLHLRDFPEPEQRLPFCKRYVSGSVVGTRPLRYRLVLLFFRCRGSYFKPQMPSMASREPLAEFVFLLLFVPYSYSRFCFSLNCYNCSEPYHPLNLVKIHSLILVNRSLGLWMCKIWQDA